MIVLMRSTIGLTEAERLELSHRLFFLPRYSPDLNPIEQVFTKLKTPLRKTDPRTIEATWRGIDDLLDRFTPHECANYLTNASYASV